MPTPRSLIKLNFSASLWWPADRPPPPPPPSDEPERDDISAVDDTAGRTRPDANCCTYAVSGHVRRKIFAVVYTRPDEANSDNRMIVLGRAALMIKRCSAVGCTRSLAAALPAAAMNNRKSDGTARAGATTMITPPPPMTTTDLSVIFQCFLSAT